MKFSGTAIGQLWLPIIVTISATWMSNYLFDRDGPIMDGRLCCALHAAAWTTVFLTWRGFRSIHGGSLTGYFFAIAVAMMLVGPCRTLLFPCPPRPEVIEYKALLDAVRSDNAAEVDSILRHFRVPDFDSEPSSKYCGTDERCESAVSPLLAAVQRGNFRIAAALLDHGAVATAGDADYDPLVAAAERGDTEMMALLLHHGAKVNDDADDSFALWYAVQHRQRDATMLLLKLGANPNTVGDDGRGSGESVLRLARDRGSAEIASLIAAAAGKP